jgi:hypothetical protein
MTDNAWTLGGNAATDPAHDFLGTSDNQSMVIKTNGDEAIRIDTAGQVGVGVVDPRAQLHVRGRIATGLDFAAPGALTLFPSDGFAWFHVDNGPSESRATGRLRVSAGVNPGDLEIMSFLQDGRVGVGTAAPAGKLHVESDADFTVPQVTVSQTRPFEFARLRLRSTGTDPDSRATVPYPAWDLAAGRGQLHVFVENTGNVMSFLSDGRVGIGTESPASALHVAGTATVGVLAITGGADVAEVFSTPDDQVVEPGTVMVIDEERTGMVTVSSRPYDRKVAGVVSGAGGIGPGITLTHAAGRPGCRVALTGRVLCNAVTDDGPIKPGDLLTTSAVAGHAMRAEDPSRAHGAVLGKAMSALHDAAGLVLVLLCLQ